MRFRFAASIAALTTLISTPALAQLSGAYTIGGVGPDYATWGAAISDLNTLGVSGPVTFLVASGTYTEQVFIDNPPGVSATNTVTFLGVSVTRPILQFTPTAFASNWVLRMDLADHFTFEHLHFKALGATGFGHVIEMKASDNNTFEDCIFDGVDTGSVTLNESIIYTPDDGATPLRNEDNTFHDNVFNNGSRAIHLFGEPIASPSGVTITNNTFNSQVLAAVETTYHTSLTIEDNVVRDDTDAGTAYDAFDLSASDGTIARNDVSVGTGRGALRIELPNIDGRRYTIANNFFNVQGLNTLIAVFLADEADFYHNTVRLSSLDAGDQALRVDAVSDVNVIDNIVISVLSGYAFYVESGATLASDHNDLYSALGPDRYFWMGTDYGNFEDFQAAALQDSSSVARVVTFTDATNGDLHLDGASTSDPFLGGIPIGAVPEDIDGDARSLIRPFMGADDTGVNIDPLCGPYTVGGASPDYALYNDAVTDLLAKGISCSVTFDVRPVTFTEQITIGPVEGSSAADTVLFHRSNPSTAPILEYASTGSTDNWVVRFDSAAHITVDGHTLTALGPTRGRVLAFRDGSHDNRISNSTINGLTSGGTLSGQALAIFTTASLQEGNEFVGNTFNDGTIGFNAQNGSQLTILRNNQFVDQRFHAVRVTGHEQLFLEGNAVTSSGPDASYAAFSITEGFDSDIVKNTIETDVGVGILADSTGKSLNPTRYHNNFVVAPIAVKMDRFNTIELNHNSLLVKGTDPVLDMSGGTPASATTIKNNLIINLGGGPAYDLGPFLPVGTDYNNLYTTGGVLAVDGGTNYVDLPALQAGTGRDPNSISKAIDVVSDSSPYDLHLDGTSDGDLDLGAPPLAGIGLDIDGELRSDSLTYMGADEATPFFALCGGYTIDKTGVGDYLSFSEAAADLNSAGISCTVTFVAFPGVYNEQVEFGFIPGTSPTDTVLFITSDPSDPPMLEYAPSGSGDNFLVKFDSTDHVTLDHVWMTNTGSLPFGRVVVLENGSDNNRIRSSIINGLAGAVNRGGSLIHAVGTNNSGNHFLLGQYNDGYRAIDLEGVSAVDPSSGTQVSSLTFSNQYDRGVHLRFQNNARVENVTINDGASSQSMYLGMQVGGDTATVVRNKIILTEGAAGMRIAGDGSPSSRRFVANNFISIDGSDAARAFFASGPYVDFFHNSVVVGSSAPVGATAIFLEGDADEVSVINNLLIGEHGGYVYRTGVDVTGLTSDYNNVYQTAGPDPIGSWDGTDAADLPAFQALSGTDANSSTSAVTFVSTSDLHLDGASIGDGTLAGIPLASVPFDIDFNIRSLTAPYMGADEAGTPLTPPLRLDLKAFLEGPFGADSMSATLNPAGYIPTGHPYAGAPWSYAGSEAVSPDDLSPANGIPDFFDANPSVVDWVLVELRSGDPMTSMTIEGTRTGFVLRDGSVVGPDGLSLLAFPGVASGSYYVVLDHRNHLPVMSPLAVTPASDTLFHDFRSDAADAYSDGGAAMKSLSGSFWGLFSSDGNADGLITAPDFNDWNAATTAGVTGYDPSDFNLDGLVTAPDFNQWNANTTAGASTQVP